LGGGRGGKKKDAPEGASFNPKFRLAQPAQRFCV
jgi:hypothetical protein